MGFKRILSLFLALLMLFSTFAQVIPANVFATETEELTEIEEITEEPESDVIASYEIPLEEITLEEDGSMYLDLSDFEPIAAESEEIEPEVVEPEEAEPEVVEPEEAEPEVVEPEEAEPEVVEPEEAEPEVVEPEEAEPEVVEPEEAGSETAEPEETKAETAEPEAVSELLTWFQWIQEKDLDTSSLTKEDYASLSEEYSAYRINTLTEMGELAEGAAYGMVSNNNIEIAVGSDGRFTIGNRAGNPNYPSDDYKILLFGHPNPSTSQTLIYIDGSYQNFFYADSTTYSYNTAVSTMSIPSYGIKVEQTLKLIKLGSSSFEDTVQIQYKVINTDNESHNVGIRIMMDTMLADNDYATYHLTSMGHITEARVFTGSAIPSTYQFYDNIQNPTTIATGHLYRSGDRMPDKVQFCNWGGIMGSDWNHSVRNGDYLGDSAVGIYFNPCNVRSGKDFTVRTYYGVSLGTTAGESTEVNSNEVQLTIKDSYTQEPLENVTVTYKIGLESSFRTVTTNSNGMAVLTGFRSSRERENTMITLTKDGYKSSSFRANFRGGDSATYQMSLEESPKPVINSILLDTGVSTVNLQTGSYTADEDPNDYISKNGATGTITIKATSDMEGCTWYLVQDEKVIQRNASGEFTFNIREVTKDNGDKRTYIEEFTPDGNRYIYCVSPQGEKSEKMRFGLNIRAGVELKFGDLDLGKVWPSVDGTLAEGSLGALFLGNKVSFGPKNSKFKVFAELTEDGVVRVGINYEPPEDNHKKVEEFEEDFKKQLKNFIKGKNHNIKNAVKKVGKFSYGAGDAEFIFCGYGEGQVENGTARVDVTIILGAKASAHHTWQFLAWSVPVYVDVGAEIGAELAASANIVNTEGLGFRFYNAEFSPEASVWLEGGAGVKRALSIGVKGTATLSLDWNLVTQYVRADLTGSASLVAEAFGIFEKDLEFAKATVPIYDSNRDGEALGGDENVFEMLHAQPFRLITREESADGGTSQYATNARIVTVNGQQYKFFATDRGGDLSNRYMLCWSKLVNGVWTDAVPVDDDGTSDLYYDVAVSGSDIYVVWSNSSQIFDDATVTLDEFAAAQEICLAAIDSTTGTTDDTLQLTSNTIMDTQPAVTVLDGTAYVAWSHTANSMEDMDDVYDNYLHYTSVTGGIAGETQVVNFANAAINTISASSASGKPLATVVSNSSDELNLSENETTVVDMSNGTKTDVDTTDKVIGKTVSGTIDGTEKIFWMENGNVAYADSITSEDPTYIFTEDTIPGTITEDNYTVITVGDVTYLIWSQGSGEEGVPASAMTAIYANGAWGSVHKLTELSTGNIVKLDGYLNAEGKLVLVYTVKTIYVNDAGNNSMNSSSYEKIVEPEKSIRIADLKFQVSDAVPGETLPLTLEVVNTGNTTVDSLELYINSEANEDYRKTLTDLSIAPGTSDVIEISDFVLSDSLTTRTYDEGQYVYTLTANAAGSEICAEETFEIGYDNVVLRKLDTAYVDNKETIVIAVENNSGFPATNVRVQILADAVDGVLVYDHTFDEIGANDLKTIYLPVEDLDSNSLFATVSSYCTAAESSEYVELILNNSSTMATLTMEALGCGSVTPAEETMYDIGASVDIEAIPDEGYLFDGWSSNRELVYQQGSEDTAEATIEMPSGNTVITAKFVSETPYDFTLSAESVEMKAGQQGQLVANFESLEKTGKVTWSSSNESVATVSNRGVVTGVSAGTAEITAVCGPYTHSCQVTVSYVDVTDIRMIYPSANLLLNETAAVEVLTEPANGIHSLAWKSSNESVATVDAQGNVTAVGYGEAVITATACTNPNVTGSYTVHVIRPVDDIALNQYELELNLDNQAQLQVSYLPADANYGQQITWSVDSDGILELESSGEHNEILTVTARQKGNVIVTATSEAGHQASCMVSVKDIVYAQSVEDLRCEPYEHNMDRTWIYEDETKRALVVRFSEDTYIYGNDELQLLDGDGNVIASSRYTSFSGNAFLVRDSALQIRLVTGNYSYGDCGFRVESIDDEILAADINIWTEDVTYTGKAQKPAFQVYFQNSQLLTAGTDYTLSYSNNKNIGTATVKFTGKGLFKGVTVKKTFRIVPGKSTLNATVDSNGIKLTWGASKGAGGYLLYRNVNDSYNENGLEWKLLKKLSGSAKTYTDKSTNGENVYRYKLVPYKNVTTGKKTTRFESLSSEYGPITRLGPVKKLTGTNDFSNNRITLKWNAVSGADGYIVYRSDNGYGYYVDSYTTETQHVAYAYSSALYQFKIVPYKYVTVDGYRFQCNGAASGVYSAYRLSTPNLNCWSSGNQVQLWYGYDYVKNQTGIQIYRSADNGRTWRLAKNIKCGTQQPGNYISNDFTDTKANPTGTTYQYKARSYVTVDQKTYYGSWSDVAICLGRPVITSVKAASDGGLNVSWKRILGAQWYEIQWYYMDTEGESTRGTETYYVTNANATSYTFRHEGAAEAGRYAYQIRAYGRNSDTYEEYSSVYSEGKLGYVMDKPTLNYASNSSKGTQLGWRRATFATGVEIWRSTNGGKYSKIKTVTGGNLVWNDTTATKNKATYSYKIRSYAKEDGVVFYSSFSDVLSVSKMTPPTVKSLKALTGGGFKLTFSAVKDAAGYDVIRWNGQNTGDSVYLGSISSTGKSSYTITDPDASDTNVLYQYEIIAWRNEKNGASTTAAAYAMGYNYDAPEVRAENTQKGIMIYASVPDTHNTDHSYADSYTIYRSVNGGSYKKLKSVNADSDGQLKYNDTTAASGKRYSYKVKASGSKSMDAYTSKWSAATEALRCTPGPVLSSVSNAVDGITIQWKSQKGMPAAAEYRIYRSKDNFHYDYIGSADSNTFTYTDTVGEFNDSYSPSNNIYYYKVSVVPANSRLPEAFSQPQSIMYMLTPVVITANYTNSNQTKAYVGFQLNGYYSGYYIRYKTGNTVKTVKNTNLLTDLKPGARYEITIRSYLNYNGKNYYSAWSRPYYLEN